MSILLLAPAVLLNSICDKWLIFQKKNLLLLYDTKVKDLVKKLLTLDKDLEMYVLVDFVLCSCSMYFSHGEMNIV